MLVIVPPRRLDARVGRRLRLPEAAPGLAAAEARTRHGAGQLAAARAVGVSTRLRVGTSATDKQKTNKYTRDMTDTPYSVTHLLHDLIILHIN